VDDNSLSLKLDRNRRGLFHLAIAVDEVGGDNYFGEASGPMQDNSGGLICTDVRDQYGAMIFKCDFLDHTTDTESIVFMHELGHTLGLCHRPEDELDGEPARPRVTDSNCPNPPNCNDDDCYDCSHYQIPQSSDTAMGQSSGWTNFTDAIDREIMFEKAEWNALNLRGIRCWPRSYPYIRDPNDPPETRNTDNLCWPDGFPP
jgi:hypothetical protein